MNNFEHTILIVDDSRANLELLTRMLMTVNGPAGSKQQNPCKVIVAKSGTSAIEKAVMERPDLILLDIVMPGMSGFEVLEMLKSDDSTREIPVIIITGLDSVSDEERGFALGAVDYIAKPFHASIVKARVRTHLRIVDQMREIDRLSMLDPLTDLPNRRSFNNRMILEWGRAIRERAPLSFLMADIDHFKWFNDTYGHPRGDEALVDVARIISSITKRATDHASRWGGEEFALILPNTDIEGALVVAEYLRGKVERSPLKVTISLGANCITPRLNDRMSDFIERADQALYIAKLSGRNRVERGDTIILR